MAHLLRGARTAGGCERRGPTGRSLLAEHGLLEGLGDREADLLAGGDLDGLARLGIAADAGLHLPQPEDAESWILRVSPFFTVFTTLSIKAFRKSSACLRLTPPASASFATNCAFVIAVPPWGSSGAEKTNGAPYADAPADVKEVRIYQGLATRRLRAGVTERDGRGRRLGRRRGRRPATARPRRRKPPHLAAAPARRGCRVDRALLRGKSCVRVVAMRDIPG